MRYSYLDVLIKDEMWLQEIIYPLYLTAPPDQPQCFNYLPEKKKNYQLNAVMNNVCTF